MTSFFINVTNTAKTSLVIGDCLCDSKNCSYFLPNASSSASPPFNASAVCDTCNLTCINVTTSYNCSSFSNNTGNNNSSKNGTNSNMTGSSNSSSICYTNTTVCTLSCANYTGTCGACDNSTGPCSNMPTCPSLQNAVCDTNCTSLPYSLPCNITRSIPVPPKVFFYVDSANCSCTCSDLAMADCDLTGSSNLTDCIEDSCVLVR